MSTGSLDRLQRNSVKNMHKVLGIDTSNYTTSAALYTGGKIRQEKQLLAAYRNIVETIEGSGGDCK